MIEEIAILGELIQDKENIENQVLLSRTYQPKEVYRENNKEINLNEIIINIDTKEKKIEIKIKPIERKQYYCYSYADLGSRSKKIPFSTNKVEYLLYNISDQIEYIEKYVDKKNTNIEKYLEFLKALKNAFYKTLKNEKNKEVERLNFDLFEKSASSNVKTVKDLQKKIEEELVKIVNSKKILKKSNLFTLTIDDKRIEETKHFEAYKKVLFNQFVETNFLNKQEKRKNKLCHICNKNKEITGKIDIPIKFYITEKKTFFPELMDSNKYKSFSMCKDCYIKFLLGFGHIKNNLSSNFYGNYYLIPKNLNSKKDLNILEFVKDRILELKKNKKLDDNIQTKEKIYEKLIENALKFDLLFFERNNSQIIINKHIHDIYVKNLIEMYDKFSELKEKVFEDHLKVDLWNLFPLLYPTTKILKTKIESYKKELLNFYEIVLTQRKVNYSQLIRLHNTVFKKMFFKNAKKYYLSNPIKLNFFLKLFQKLNMLEGIIIKEVNTVTKIDDKNIMEYFEKHKEVYSNLHKQGLFLLGMLIRSIQKNQKKNNVLNKLNFDGIKPNKIKELTNKIIEVLKIYSNKKRQSLFDLNLKKISWMNERLEGIEQTNLSKDEILFYILSGLSFSYFLGIKYNEEKKENESEENEKMEAE